MKINNNKGFTLVELIATIVLLAIVTTIGGFAIGGIISSSKEKDYEMLVINIKDAVEVYYQECRYAASSSIQCPAGSTVSGITYYEVTLSDLITYGYLDGNSTDSANKKTIVNPTNKQNIASCVVKYYYANNEVAFSYVSSNASKCPRIEG